MDTKLLFAPITKFEKDPVTGFVTVYGKMTGPDLDLAGQICDPAWLAKAVPEWFVTGANVREMHQPKAVGVGQQLEQITDDYWLKALIVDPLAGVKVETGVFTGFSIGIKNLKVIKDAVAPNGRIVGGSIIETSLGDRPCNPTCKFVVTKLAAGAGARLEYAGEWATKAEGDMAGDVPAAGDAGTAGSGTDPAGAAGDEAAEADVVDQIRTLLTGWLASEAGEVAAGVGGTFVVRLILDLLENLNWAECEDLWDDAQAAVDAAKNTLLKKSQEDPMDLATVNKLVTAASGKAATADDRAQLAGLRKALGVDVVDGLVGQLDEVSTKLDGLPGTIAAEATKVMAPGVERIEALEGDVKKLLDTVQSTGPVRVGGSPGVQIPDAVKAEAAQLRQKASTVHDRTLADGYRLMADRLDPPRG